MPVSYTGIDRLVFDDAKNRGSFYRVKYDYLGRISSKTFTIAKYGSKDKAYDAALVFHKKCYPFYSH